MKVVSQGPVKITKATIDRVWRNRSEKERYIVRDSVCRGLALMVNATTARWEFVYRPRGLHPLTGKRWPNRTVTLGTPESLSIDDARIQAARLKGEAMAGGDPLEERREAVIKARIKAALTVERLIDDWVKARSGDRRPSYVAGASASLKRHFASWMSRAASSILTSEAVEELDRIKREAGPVAAIRALSCVRAVYGWAVKRQMVAANPFASIEAPARSKARDRVLSTEEVGAIWCAAGRLDAVYAGFVRVLLLTLQRREEVASMRWAEVDLDKGIWMLPAERVKNGKAHIVHLAEPVKAIIEEMPHPKGCEFVFSAASKKPISAYSSAKRQLDKLIAKERGEDAAKVPGWTMHDFRRAGVTGLAGMGFAPHVCDRLLNHVSGSIQGVAAIYQRAEFLLERKAALEAWAAHVLLAAKDEPAAVKNLASPQGITGKALAIAK